MTLLRRLWSLVPSGGSLPESVWRARHRFLVGLTFFHVVMIALAGFVLGKRWELGLAGFLQDDNGLHVLGEAMIVAFFGTLACWRRAGRTVQATFVGFGLMSSSAILVHLSGGYIEFHFHFFVMLSFLALLQDWVPYILAILYVVLHHGIMGALWPEEVFNHAAAINAPWTWAGIHAFFILCSCEGNIIAWRFNEQSLDRIKHQAAELEEANKLQADFTAMIAHDLRAPISTVLNTAEVMENGIFGTISQEQQEWLGKMQKTCRAVLEIVSDFLDISKIEAGRLDLIKERIDLYKLIQGSLESYVPMATVKNIALTSQVEPNLPDIVADARRLEQVLANLISNAIKFTGAGGTIEVGAGRLNGDVRFWGKDSGEGIAADELADLFEKYRQTTSGKKSTNKGTGLGLAICKKIAEAHGDKIFVESSVGQGSTFAVEIPRH